MFVGYRTVLFFVGMKGFDGFGMEQLRAGTDAHRKRESKTITATKSVGSRIAEFVKGLFSFDGFAVPVLA